MKILQLTAHFEPNVGGVETHLSDLVSELAQKNFEITVLAYLPLTTNARAKIYESKINITIFRIPWLKGFFYKLVNSPVLEFIYLFPGLFFVTPFILLLKRPQVIHAHGLVAGTVGLLWAKTFNKRIIISLHSIYHFPKEGIYRNFVKWLFLKSDKLLCLSKQSADEVLALGIKKDKVVVFTYWIDLEVFINIPEAKKKLQWGNELSLLFVGRLVPEKGIRELLKATTLFKANIHTYIVGVGPLDNEIKTYAQQHTNVTYLGKITPTTLPLYYSAADLLIVPSTHEEGFGRVILESLACGTPVVAANRGAIPEAIDSTVGRLITISPENIAQEINQLHRHNEKIQTMSRNSRKFVEKRYSKNNIAVIVNSYVS